MQSLADPHDTAESTGDLPRFGFGVGWIDQLDPFQASASVPALELPTAVQALDEVHDTPDRYAPFGLGVL